MVNRNKYIINIHNSELIQRIYYCFDKSSINHICINNEYYNICKYIRCIQYRRFGIFLKIKNTKD